MRESTYQAQLIRTLRDVFPGCVILKNDTEYRQGIPDLLILYHTHWAMLEVKPSVRSKTQPNQAYYVDLFNDMSFAAFVCPENEEDVIHALQRAFTARRTSRVSQR